MFCLIFLNYQVLGMMPCVRRSERLEDKVECYPVSLSVLVAEMT